MTWKFPLADIDFGPDEVAKVQSVLESRWLTMGSVTQAFEQAAADYLGVKHAIAVTNATAGLHLACSALGISEGDEVIVPSLTFVATSNAVLYTRGVPVFADITSLKDLDISPAAIEKQINEKTRAIMVMHYGGYACDMERISLIAKMHNLHLIEDAAHAIGSELEGHMLGTLGEVGVYSFFSNKNMTTGEGGMVVTNDDEIARKVRLMRSHGMTSLTWDRHQGHAWDYDVVELGYNYRIDEMRAALGIVQLAKLDKNNQRRRELTGIYQELISERIPEMVVPFVEHRGLTAAHIMPVMLPQGTNRSRFMEGMKTREIQTSHHYPPIHRFTAYVQNPAIKAAELPVTDEAAEREVTLPLYPGLRDEDVETIVQAVLESLD